MEEKEELIEAIAEGTTPSAEGTTPTPIGSGEQMQTGSQPVSMRETIVERLKGFDPEGTYDTDEDIYGGVNSVLDEQDRVKEHNRELAAVFRRSPQAASFFLDLMDGKGIYESLGRNFGDDLQAVLSGDSEAAKEYDKGLAEWQAKEDERMARDEAFRKNSDATMAEYEAWLKDMGYTPEDRAALEEDIQRISQDMGTGKFIEFVKALHRNRRYDGDIENARAEGEIRGRNAKITEERSLPKRGDGLPVMDNRTSPEKRDSKPNGWSW